MKQHRHRLKHLHLILPILWLGALVYLWWIYADLPDKVGVHFDFMGQADRFGNKASLVSLPIIFMLLWIVMALLIYGIPVVARALNQHFNQTQHRITIGLFYVIHVTIWLAYMNQLFHQQHGEHNINPFFLILIYTSVLLYFIISITVTIIHKRQQK